MERIIEPSVAVQYTPRGIVMRIKEPFNCSCVLHVNFPLFVKQVTVCPSLLQERERDCLRVVLCYKRLFTKACIGCKRFFLKERKNVMF